LAQAQSFIATPAEEQHQKNAEKNEAVAYSEDQHQSNRRFGQAYQRRCCLKIIALKPNSELLPISQLGKTYE
jgi:hypothetical protein